MGLIISRVPSLTLLIGATQDGYADIDSDVELPASLEPDYSRILTSILLYGKAILAGPPFIWEGVDCERLLSEELVEFPVCDAMDRFHDRISGLYRSAYRHLEEAEADPAFSTITSLDRLSELPLTGPIRVDNQTQAIPKMLDLDRVSLDTDLHISEAVNSTMELIHLIQPLLEQFATELNTLWNEEFELVYETLHLEAGTYAERSLRIVELPEREDQVPRSLSPIWSALLSNMGLRQLAPEDIEHGRLDNYLPGDLTDIWGLEGLILGPRQRFRDEMEMAFAIGMRDSPREFIAMHSFWSTLLSFYQSLALSSETGAPLLNRQSGSGSPVRRTSSDAGDLARLSEDRVAMFRTVLLERRMIPKVGSIDELLRLRDDSRVQSLQHRMAEWQSAIANGEMESLEDLRREIDSEARRAKVLGSATRVGRILTWVAAPIGVLDAEKGTLFGLPVALSAPLVDLAIQRLDHKYSWVRLGMA